MIVNYYFINKSKICTDKAIFDDTMDHTDLLKNIQAQRPEILEIITDYKGQGEVGWAWNGTSFVDPNPNQSVVNKKNPSSPTVI